MYIYIYISIYIYILIYVWPSSISMMSIFFPSHVEPPGTRPWWSSAASSATPPPAWGAQWSEAMRRGGLAEAEQRGAAAMEGTIGNQEKAGCLPGNTRIL